ncbi:MAG: hypothetical protein JXD19_09400 [Deltaproteobacteria bacterium]|nr:hypothetical protein [Deltaproteobacteria bacterium]
MAKDTARFTWNGGVLSDSYDDFLRQAMTSSYYFCDQDNSIYVIADPWLTSKEMKAKLQALIDSQVIEAQEAEKEKRRGEKQ